MGGKREKKRGGAREKNDLGEQKSWKEKGGKNNKNLTRRWKKKEKGEDERTGEKKKVEDHKIKKN